MVWVPVIAALFAYAVVGRDLAPPRVLGLAVVGLFVWTFVEYALHRFAFHHEVRSPFGRRLHFLAHGIHHLDPWDRLRLVFPPLPGLPDRRADLRPALPRRRSGRPSPSAPRAR